MTSPKNMHATGIIVGNKGLLITGRSGAGKSLLALELLAAAKLAGQSASLVADDQVLVEKVGSVLKMVAPPDIAGKIELRGRGIVTRSYVERAQINLVVDLVEQLERMVAPECLYTRIAGIQIARCPVPERGVVDSAHQLLLVREALFVLE